MVGFICNHCIAAGGVRCDACCCIKLREATHVVCAAATCHSSNPHVDGIQQYCMLRQTSSWTKAWHIWRGKANASACQGDAIGSSSSCLISTGTLIDGTIGSSSSGVISADALSDSAIGSSSSGLVSTHALSDGTIGSRSAYACPVLQVYVALLAVLPVMRGDVWCVL